MNERVEILIVSYAKDIQWLLHCLNSIKKFASGFSQVTVLHPLQEGAQFYTLPKQYGVRLMNYKRVNQASHWHLDHQRMKCRADEVCPGCEFIVHVDSDCVFTEHVTPDDYFVDGKPVLLIQPYSTFTGEVPPWKESTHTAIGNDVKYETMRRHPAVHHRGLYADLRKRVEEHTGMSFDRFMLTRKPDFPWGVSEFNILGQIALSDQWKDRYHFIDTSSEAPPHSKLTQFWSHGGLRYPYKNPDGSKRTAESVFAELGI